MKKIIFTFIAFLILCSSAFAFRVQDTAGVLSVQEKNVLEQKIDAYERASNNQIAFVIVPTIGDKELQPLALETAQKMGIGHKDKNNGILVFLTIKEKKMSIQVGEGLEGAYPDMYARMSADAARPSINEGKIYDGLNIILKDIALKTSDEYKNANPAPKNESDPILNFFFDHWLAILIIFGILFALDIATIPWKEDIWMFTILCIILSFAGSSSSSKLGGGGSFGGGGWSD